MSTGLFLLAAGLFVISLLDVGSGYPPFLGGLVPAGFGIGLSGAVGTSAITGSLTPAPASQPATSPRPVRVSSSGPLSARAVPGEGEGGCG
ncbi:hypothetical protein [Streptomyces roseirectus]|uniref:hypothetical protein n=1 Tax=Streptomyces roseirectus TaxID=2768066 RepID=UPI001FEA5647|nr:hypothetical protein [Streptomyces roseirectus]